MDARNRLQQTNNDIMSEKRQRRALYNMYMKEKEVPKPMANTQPALLRKPTPHQQLLQQQRVISSQAGAPSLAHEQGIMFVQC